MPQPPLLTLLTDFGTQDVFVGVMKGVIYDILPTARIVDLSHEVPAQDIAAGAHYLQLAWSYFPAGTVHIVVVDPGVGTDRKAVAVRCADQVVVAPDNGLLAPLVARYPWEGVELTNPAYQLSAVSQTFHGRDIFAPAGAHLAAGVPLARLGEPVTTLQPGAWPTPSRVADRLTGRIWWIDHFGNLITDLNRERVEALPQPVQLQVGDQTLTRLATSYGDGEPGELLMLYNSFGYLEIAVNGGHAARTLGIERGTQVVVESIAASG